MPKYVPGGGGSKPHYGSIVMIGDPKADYPLINSSALFGKSVLGSLLFAGGDFLVNFLGHHLPASRPTTSTSTPPIRAWCPGWVTVPARSTKTMGS